MHNPKHHVIKMQHTFFMAASLFMLSLLLGQSSALVVANSLDSSSEQENTSDLQPPPAICHREDLTVGFADAGLSYISKPETVNIGQCVGFCPEVSGGFTSLYNKLRRLSGDPPNPCCVPTSFLDIQVLVTVYNPTEKRYETRLEVLEKTIVAECGCL